MADQELRSRVTIEGADLAAKQLQKVAAATEELGEVTKEANRVASEAGEERSTSALTNASAASAAGFMAVAIGKIALAVRATVKAFRLLPSAGAVVASILSIVAVLKDEVAERLRLVRVMKLQGEAQDELQGKQRDQRQSLEGVSDQRRFGGFDADISRRVQAQAINARQEFSQLSEENVNAVFGTFGGLGLSQRDLTDLAILQQSGQLDFEPGQFRSGRSATNFAQRNLRRGRARGTIDTFAGRESVQGQGLGRAEFRPAVTEADQILAEQFRGGPGSADDLLRERFARAIKEGDLPPDADIEQLIKIVQNQATADELQANTVGFADGRPITTAINRFRIRPRAEVALQNQPGFGNQAQEALGLTENFEELPLDVLEALLKLNREAQQAGNPGGSPNITFNITNNNFQGQRVVTPSARTQQKVISNGGNALSSRELVGVG